MPSLKTCSGESMCAPVCRLWFTLDTCQKPGPRRCGVTSSFMFVDGGLIVSLSTVTDRSMMRRLMAPSRREAYLMLRSRPPPDPRRTVMRRHVLVLFAALVAVAVVATGSATWAQKGPIKMGMVVSLSGGLAPNGKDMVNGMQLFLDEQGGKLAGRQVQLIVEDDEGKPATGLTKERSLVEGQGVHLLIGPVSAAIGYAIHPYVDGKKMPTIHPIVAGEDLTQRKRSPWVVRTGWASAQPSHPFGEYAAKTDRKR